MLTGKTQILKRQGKINNQKNQGKKGKQKGKKERKETEKGFLFFFLVKPWKMGKKESLAGNSLVGFCETKLDKGYLLYKLTAIITLCLRLEREGAGHGCHCYA